MKSAWVLVAVLAMSASLSSVALAADGDDDRKEKSVGEKSASDSARIQQLSDELKALRALMDTQAAELEAVRGSVNGKAALNLDGTTLPKELQAAAQEPKPAFAEVVKSKWAMNIYGFVEADFIYDNRIVTGFTDGAANPAMPLGHSYLTSHDQLTFGARNSRIGFNASAPEVAGIRASAKLEMDFEGVAGGGGNENNGTWTNPTFRFRHMYLTLDSDIVTLQLGQGWQLFGWQPYFHPNTVDIQGVPGQIYSRSPKAQATHKFRGPVDIELGVSMSRPPQRASGTPDLQGGVKITIPDWVGVHTIGATGTAVDAAGIGISGLTRSFRVNNVAPVAGVTAPTSDAVRGEAGALDIFLPILHPNKENKALSLSATGEVAYGKGFNDQFSGFSAGIGALTAPFGTSVTVADNGSVGIENGDLTAVQWRTNIVGMQFYLPPDGTWWISANYSSGKSNNIARMSNAGAATAFHSFQWVNGDIFWDVTPAVRLGLSVDQYKDNYIQQLPSHVGKDTRIQFSAFFLF
jgi:hypothetical protein